MLAFDNLLRAEDRRPAGIPPLGFSDERFFFAAFAEETHGLLDVRALVGCERSECAQLEPPGIGREVAGFTGFGKPVDDRVSTEADEATGLKRRNPAVCGFEKVASGTNARGLAIHAGTELCSRGGYPRFAVRDPSRWPWLLA